MPPPSHRAALLDLLRPDPSRRDASWYAGMDWDALLAQAGASLSPLVLHGLGARAAAIVPPDVIATLHADRKRIALLRLRQTADLRSACTALDAASVPFLVLKGAALAALVYSDPTLRPMSDLDVWVPTDRFADAHGALGARGFRVVDGVPRRLLAAGPLELELHTQLESLEGVAWADFDMAFRAGMDADLGGFHARVLAPEHQLHHTCLHLARKNRFATGLSHLVDIARIVQRWEDTWDWPRLVRDWRDQGTATWTLLALVLARDLLGAHVPAGIEAGTAETHWPSMLALAERQLWEARTHRLLPAVEQAIRHRSPSERVRWLRWRLVDYYWLAPEGRSMGRVLGDGLRRIWHDLTVRVPVYLRAWGRGDLRREALATGLELERERGELAQLVSATTPAAPAARLGSGDEVATRPERR